VIVSTVLLCRDSILHMPRGYRTGSHRPSNVLILAAALTRALRPKSRAEDTHLLLVFCSFLFLYERVRDFFASVDGRDDDQKSAARDDEAQLAIADVTVVVWITSERPMRRWCSDTYQSRLP
jgi:hypothetical protein